MEKKIKIFAFFLPLIFGGFLFSRASADTISLNASAANGIRNCAISEGFFTAPQSATISDISESIGWFNTPSGSVISYLMTSSSVVMATTTISPPQGSYSITTSTFSNSPAIVSGQTYRFCYTATVGDIINVEGDTTAPILLTTTTAATSTTPEIFFAYPPVSGETPLFSDFLFTTSENLSENIGYQVRLQYYLTTVGSSTKIIFPAGKTDFTGFAYGLGSDFMSDGIRIPRPDFGVDLATSSIIYMAAQLYNTQDPNNPNASLAFPVLVASTTATTTLLTIPSTDGDYITPWLVSSSTSPTGFIVATSSRPVGAVENPTFQDATDCSGYPFTDTYTGINIPFLASTAPQRLVCEAKKGINNFVASLGDFGSGTLENIRQKIMAVFPLNIFDHMNADMAAARDANPAGTQSIVLSGGSNVFMGRSLTIYDASSTAAMLASVGAGPGGGFPIANFLDAILYICTGGIIILLTVRQVKNMKNA